MMQFDARVRVERPPTEFERLRALRRYGIFDSPNDDAFDSLTRLAALVCNTPIALIGFVDTDRQLLKSRIGLDFSETSRDIAFCAHTILEKDVLIVRDALRDPRFAKNPLVLSDPNIRFYAGAPITTEDGFTIGTVAVADRIPRELTPTQIDALRTLSHQVMLDLEIRSVRDGLRDTMGANRISEVSISGLLDDFRVARENECRLRVTFDHAAVGLAHISIDGQWLLVNNRLCEIVGYAEKELLERSFDDFFHPGDRELDIDYHHRMLTGKIRSYSLERRNIRRDGTNVWINLTVSLVRGPSEAPEYFIAVVKDITEQKLIEEALRQSERDYHGLFEHAHDAIIILEPENEVVLEVNQRACELYGFPRSEFVGMSMKSISVDVLQGEAYVQQALEAQGHIKFDSVQMGKDGSLMYLEIIAAGVEYQGRRAVLSVNRDVTESRRAQQALRESEAQLRQSQKMEAIGRLAGGVAHDFNNLLAAIMLHSDLLRRQLKTGDPMLRRVDEIRKASERAASLTHQLLAFSRKQVLQSKVMNLNSAVADMEKMLRRLIGEDIELRTILDPNLCNVMADPSQIEQVIMNLAVNARDAMPRGGKLLIETKNVYVDDEFARLHQPINRGPHVKLVVSDSGCGMAQETLAHIFEPFFTTKEKGKGTGLGLSMVYGIIQQSEGSIWVYSEPNRGTSFKIFLPVIEGEVTVLAQGQAETEISHGTETILLVEDEEAIRQVAREILQMCGYEVLEAANAGEAILICERHYDRIDMMLTDVVLPQLSGVELADRLRPFCPNMKILFMSGYTFDTVLNHGVLIAGTSFLEKPFTPVLLSRKIREVLDS